MLISLKYRLVSHSKVVAAPIIEGDVSNDYCYAMLGLQIIKLLEEPVHLFQGVCEITFLDLGIFYVAGLSV